MTDLSIFHYHLLPGGVTSVILHSVQALLKYSQTVGRIRIVCGRPDNSDRLMDELKRNTKGAENAISLDVVPEIGYNTRTPAAADVRHLADILLERFGGGVWWVHNYHLGKNTIFTKALLRIAGGTNGQPGSHRGKREPQRAGRGKNPNNPEAASPQKIIFHVHDFPECGRYANLHRMQAEIDLPLYPAAPHIAYATINERDARLLRNAGVPDQDVFRLDNPVPPIPHNSQAHPETAESRRRLFNTHGSGSTRLYPAGKLLFYPVRTIRRKNVLEAGLIAAISPTPANLIVTLPGVSAAEKGYSDLVARCFAEGLIPGFWGIGPELAETDSRGLTFSALARCADMVISSSVQEGFGYMFIDALGWRKPIFARYMDILDGIIDEFPEESCRFYTSLRVPLTQGQAEDLRNRYRHRLESLSGLIPENAARFLRKEIGQIVVPRTDLRKRRVKPAYTADFSFLPVEMQYDVLVHAQEKAYAHDIRALNSALLTDLQEVLQSVQEPQDQAVERRFGFQAFAGNVDHLIRSRDIPADSDKTRTGPYRRYNSRKVEHAMIMEFAVLDNLRLLHAY